MEYSIEIVNELISKGADINAKDIINQIRIILIWFKIILFRWRKLNHQNQTSLHITAEFSYSKEIVEILISKGAAINSKDTIYQMRFIKFFIKII